MTDELTDTERAILQLERSWFKYSGQKENVVRDQFDLSLTRYYQQLNALIDRPAALAHDPLTVRRLRRLRTLRAERRGRLRATFDQP